MKRPFIVLCTILIWIDVSAQFYPFDSIPPDLKRRADAVVRSEQCLYTILGPGKAVEKVKVVITILNEKAESYSDVRVNYDNFSRVKYLVGVLYDETGKTIKVLGITSVYDMSAVPGGTFYSDDRIKYLNFPRAKYPYTIEYEYEKEYSGILNYPRWNFQPGLGIAVEKSGIQFVVPKGMAFRYYERNLKNSVDSVITGDSRIYTWQEDNIRAVAPQWSYVLRPVYTLPVLYTAPKDFKYGGYEGSMSSWKALGDWNYNLIKGRDVLPQEDISKVNGIVSKSTDKREITRLIFEYMQSRTRYVSIQVGIGGFQPAKAEDVAKNGYGDCKALVNYTKALLKAAGINSYYTLVTAGEDRDPNPDFVADFFNHIILCVPLQKDTVWLECTDPTIPFNYLGSFTDDRHALLITPEGGKIVRTPEFRKNDNLRKRTGTVSLYESVASLIKISDYYSGYNYWNATSTYGKQSEVEMKRNLYSTLRFYDFAVNSVSYNEVRSEKPSASFSYGISVNDLTVTMGKRIFFNPTIEKDGYLKESPVTMLIPKSEIRIDSLSYYLPYGYRIEYLPENITLDTEFGRFSYQLKAEGNKIIYTRYLEFNKGIVSQEKFQELRKFINSIAKADMERIILSN